MAERAHYSEQLRSYLTALTKPHFEETPVNDVVSTSTSYKHIAQALITQLESSVHPAKRGGGVGGAGFGSKPPVNLSAVSLLDEIHRAVQGYPGTTLVDRLTFVANETLELGQDHEIKELSRQFGSYVGRIRQLIYGLGVRKLRLACPSCKQSYTLDTEGVRQMCLEFFEGFVSCKSCGQWWHALDLAELLDN